MKRLITILTIVLACSCPTEAHYFEVQMRAQFPTVARSGINLWMSDADTGQPVDGALLELQVKHGSSMRTLSFHRVALGQYAIDENFEPGQYTFTIADRTVPGEPLVKTFSGTMPRPGDQDVREWQWPPSKGVAGPNVAVLGGLLAIPALILLGGLGLMLVNRSSRKRGAAIKS